MVKNGNTNDEEHCSFGTKKQMKVEIKVAKCPWGYAYKESGFIGGRNGSVFSISELGGLLEGMAVVNGESYKTENQIIIQIADY